MFNPPPFNPVEPCEILAENTSEALRVVRQGDWFYKFLRPHDSFPGQTAEQRRKQIELRVQESRRHAELNPLAYDEAANCLVSHMIDDRHASTRECNDLVRRLAASSRAYVLDIAPKNVRIKHGDLVAVDFAIDEDHLTSRHSLGQQP